MGNGLLMLGPGPGTRPPIVMEGTGPGGAGAPLSGALQTFGRHCRANFHIRTSSDAACETGVSFCPDFRCSNPSLFSCADGKSGRREREWRGKLNVQAGGEAGGMESVREGFGRQKLSLAHSWPQDQPVPPSLAVGKPSKKCPPPPGPACDVMMWLSSGRCIRAHPCLHPTPPQEGGRGLCWHRCWHTARSLLADPVQVGAGSTSRRGAQPFPCFPSQPAESALPARLGAKANPSTPTFPIDSDTRAYDAYMAICPHLETASNRKRPSPPHASVEAGR